MQNKNLITAFERKETRKNPGADTAPWKGIGRLAGGLLAVWGLLIGLVFYLGISSSVVASTAAGAKHEGHAHDDEGIAPDHADDMVIPAGITGAWYNPDRDGEGFFVEVVDVDGNRVFVVTWYTYEEGEQMWLLGSAPLEPEARWVEVPMERFSGGRPGFDPGDFNPDTVERANWGTLEFSFSSCNEGSVHYEETTFGFSGTIDLTRLTSIAELGCTEPEGQPE